MACLPVVALAVAVLVVGGCGSSSHSSTASTAHRSPAPAAAKPPPVCRPQALAAVAGALRALPAAVSASATTSNGGSPECDIKARGRQAPSLQVIVDDGPQAYFRLERTEVEASQQFGTVRVEPLPTPVSHLGLDAWWFPGEQRLMTTDGTVLLTVNVRWPGVRPARRQALGVVVARAYLARPRAKAAVGYPSG